MKLNRLFSLVLLAAVIVFASCSTLKKNASGNKVPYVVANRYFLKNDAGTLPNGAITTAEEFHRLFGEATAMGPGGRPTQIDFNRQFVIAVSVPETNRETTIDPVSLQRESDALVFSYSVKRGQEQSYNIQPILIVVVDKAYEGTVELREASAKK